MNIKHIIIKVTGRVQGVWFRQYVKEKALTLNLKGFVKNNSDGTVTIEACGTEFSLKELLKWSQTGSKLARVDDIEYIIDDKIMCKKDNFQIL
jgi:acylphosphatase